jgi:hypothetical protein
MRSSSDLGRNDIALCTKILRPVGDETVSNLGTLSLQMST